MFGSLHYSIISRTKASIPRIMPIVKKNLTHHMYEKPLRLDFSAKNGNKKKPVHDRLYCIFLKI